MDAENLVEILPSHKDFLIPIFFFKLATVTCATRVISPLHDMDVEYFVEILAWIDFFIKIKAW